MQIKRKRQWVFSEHSVDMRNLSDLISDLK